MLYVKGKGVTDRLTSWLLLEDTVLSPSLPAVDSSAVQRLRGVCGTSMTELPPTIWDSWL